LATPTKKQKAPDKLPGACCYIYQFLIS